MIRAYRFLMRPTVRQERALGEMLRDSPQPFKGAWSHLKTA